MNEMEKRHVLQGHEAQRVLNEDIITKAFDDVRREVRETLFGSARSDADQRESCYHMDMAITLVIEKLHNYVKKAKGIEAVEAEKETQTEEKDDG